jgi:hypothetical protein
MSLYKRLVTSSAFQEAVATAGAWYLRLAWHTSRQIFEPQNIYDAIDTPAILAMWHGQHFMMPFLKRDEPRFRAKVMISRHRDGEINARAAEKLGIGTIRGSGAHNREFNRKGGTVAFIQMLDALKQGYNVAMTADVPKVARVAGLGAIKLAQHSGRPIYPAAIASHRRIVLNSWDRSAVNLPLSRMGLVGGEAIYVPADADDATIEATRKRLEDELNRVTARAYAIADRTEPQS